MESSQKYQSLPDLDSAPDIYETPDLAADASRVSSHDWDSLTTPSEYISSEPLNAASARRRFDLSELDPSLVNFSDRGKTRGWSVRQRRETRSEKIARLHREIEQLRLPDGGEEDFLEGDGSEEDGLVADLVSSVRPESQPVTKEVAAGHTTEDDRWTLLEGRLAQLERRLGGTDGYDVGRKVKVLEAKVSLVTAPSDAVERISKRLAQLSAASASIASDARFETLLAASEQVTTLAPTLPLVLDRLRTLRGIHEQAGHVVSTLDGLDRRADERDEEIKAWRVALERAERGMEQSRDVLGGNVAVVEDLVRHLDERVSRLA